jgi:hypothetical protein
MAGNPPSRMAYVTLFRLFGRLVHQAPEIVIVFPQIGVALVVLGRSVETHREGHDYIIGIKAAAIMELDALAQGADPNC